MQQGSHGTNMGENMTRMDNHQNELQTRHNNVNTSAQLALRQTYKSTVNDNNGIF